MTNIKKIADNPDYARVDDAYIINTNSKLYREAVERRNKISALQGLGARVDSLESKIDTIINLLSKIA